MADRFEIPLDIEGVKIERVDFTLQGEILIMVTSMVEGTRCHRCGQEIKDSYGYGRELKLRHLPILGKPTYLCIRPKRYICRSCSDHPTTTQQLAWYDLRSPHTKAYEAHVLLVLVNSTVYDVSRKEGLGGEAVMGIIERHVGREVDWQEWNELPIIGIDEISLRKGHRDFVTLISARSETGDIRVLAVLPDRQKATVKAFFASIPKRLRGTIREVCTDMYEGYINAAEEVLGSRVRVVADRFHVAKLYRKGLDGLRKEELKWLKEELPAEDYRGLKGSMWLVRKRPDQFTAEEQGVVKKLFNYSPRLGLAYFLVGTLTAIFDEPLAKSEAQLKIRAWMAVVKDSELTCFDSFLKSLAERMDIITNYFVERHNSGFVEGLNNKVKVIKRRCYGILNRFHLFQRLSIDLTGYERFA
jgi:transposase